MFLFTNAPVGTRDTGSTAGSGRTVTGTASSPNGSVVDAIRSGAESSGVGFEYLLATAKRESGLDPTAKAATSSASGLFQFIDQTWLGTMKAAGAKLGLSSYADAITARPDGTFSVADAATKQQILDLRRDPRVATAMAGALTQRNRDALGASLGREPTSGDLYAAHVLGAKGAATLINSAQVSPARPAASDLPEAAASNRSLFYDKTGRARGSAELYAMLSTSTAGGQSAVAGTANVPEATTAYASLDDGLRSLFQTDRRQGAISPGVAKLWQNRGISTETARSAPTYFPRSDSEASTTVSEPETTGSIGSIGSATTKTAPILVPLPPRRPSALELQQRTPPASTKVAAAPAAVVEEQPATDTPAVTQTAKAGSGGFLDLLSTLGLRNGQ
ncbi:lytic transglycosylase domain-containing protein [Methylobacterium sp. C25]|uniref:lytic transglycosylase domain-containing protein n=1 Tax=Methylobacterium sp. C25 TaxID=2721622 RepID=UPI001F4154BA|nr:lytic transglycosylase domain-containing protein [Methylobacterium sp. C25]